MGSQDKVNFGHLYGLEIFLVLSVFRKDQGVTLISVLIHWTQDALVDFGVFFEMAYAPPEHQGLAGTASPGCHKTSLPLIEARIHWNKGKMIEFVISKSK